MSVFNCPECGGQVSTNANQCIHCGYKYNVCPDCGRVNDHINDACNGCGYRFVKQTITTNTKEFVQSNVERADVSQEVSTVTYKQWREDSNLGWYYFLKVVKILTLIAFVINIILLVIVGFITYNNPDMLGMLVFIYLIIALCFELMIMNILDVVKPFVLSGSMWRWFKRKNIDVPAVINNSFSSSFENADEKFLKKHLKLTGAAINALYYGTNGHSKAKEIITQVVGFIISFAYYYLGIDFLLANHNVRFAGKPIDEIVNITNYNNWEILVVAIVLVIINKVVIDQIVKKLKVQKSTWIKENYKEGNSIYAALIIED